MKILKKILFVVLALALVFFAMGLIKPQIEYGHTITVSKSAKEAWAVAEDTKKHGEWLDGFVSEELISGEQGTVGSKYKVVVKPSPEEDAFEMIETLIARDEYERIVMHFDSDFGSFDQTMTFTEKDGSTKVTTESIVKGSNIAMRSMVGWMETLTGSFQAKEEENIGKLREVIEANTTNYYPADIEKGSPKQDP